MSGFFGMFVTSVVQPITATGGNYVYDGTGAYVGYRFHVFVSPGIFRVTDNQGSKLFASVLVGGGGSGGTGNGTGGGGGGQVLDVTGIPLATNTDYPVSIGYGGFGGTLNPYTPTSPIPLTSPGNGQAINRYYSAMPSTWNGYSAAGGLGSGGSPTNGGDFYGQFSGIYAQRGGYSGSGYAGGSPAAGPGPKGGSGGGGGNGNGSNGGTRSGPLLLPAASYVYGDGSQVPSVISNTSYGGPGGIGFRSTIDGNTYGGGGAGALPSVDYNPGPPNPGNSVTSANTPVGFGGAGGIGPGTPDGRPNGGGGNGGYGPPAGPYNGADGVASTGGAGGGGFTTNIAYYYPNGYNGIPAPAGINKYHPEGGSGVVVIRYPYP
jgi:hypothetical protein